MTPDLPTDPRLAPLDDTDLVDLATFASSASRRTDVLGPGLRAWLRDLAAEVGVEQRRRLAQYRAWERDVVGDRVDAAWWGPPERKGDDDGEPADRVILDPDEPGPVVDDHEPPPAA